MKKSNSIFITLALVLGFSLSAGAVSKGQTCSLLFVDQRPEVKAIVVEDGMKQWLNWEQTANFEPFRKLGEAVKITTVPVDGSSVKIEVGNNVPEEVQKLVKGEQNVLWWRHPFNKSAEDPQLKATPGPITIDGYLTASRSLFINNGNHPVTVKLPADYPHGPKGQYQPGKADNRDDIASALRRSNHIDAVDHAFGFDDRLIILRELMTIEDVKTGNGFLFRDVSPFQDGHYYLPALSIPYVGREIAKLNGMDFDQFWKKNYGELLGQSKALLLVRYGLQMETPNAQNMLIQLDRNLKPTGRLVFRDVSDSYLVENVAAGLEYNDALMSDHDVKWGFHENLKPYWENSAWRMDEAGTMSVSGNALRTWGYEHDKAYFETIQSELQIKIPLEGNDYVKSADKFLKTREGKASLHAYRLRKEAEMQKMKKVG